MIITITKSKTTVGEVCRRSPFETRNTDYRSKPRFYIIAAQSYYDIFQARTHTELTGRVRYGRMSAFFKAA